MLRALVVTALLPILAAPALARTIGYPDDDHSMFTVEVPESWEAEVDEDGYLSASSADGSAWLVGWIADEQTSIEELAEEIDEELEANFEDVKLGEAVSGEVSGRTALIMDGTATEKDSRDTAQLRVVLFDVTEKLAGALYAVTYDSSSRKAVNELAAVLDSIAMTESEDIADDAQGDDEAWTHLAVGQWEPVLELGGALYPSLLVATATMNMDEDDDDPTTLGDPIGTFGVAIRSPRAGCPITVEVESTKAIKRSTFTGTMAESSVVYGIFPVLKFDYDTLLGVKQAHPEDVTFTVSIDGKPSGEITKRVQVRPINDCVFGFVDYDGGLVDVSWMFAAYVNEDSPVIDEVLGEALDAGSVNAFAGYQGDREAVLEEMEAIWTALQDRGFRYSNITTTSGGEEGILSQHVRMLSESARTSQANCVDGSVMLASILRKLGLDTFLVLVPGHMFLGVNLDETGEESICIETTMLGHGTLEEAIEAGIAEFEEQGDAFETDKSGQHAIISIAEARKMGIVPLRDGGK